MHAISKKIHQSLILISLFTLSACQTNDKIKIEYPAGGYEYPKHVEDKDTSFYCYPLKDVLAKRDSFNEAYFGNCFLKKFNEPNLSLKPFGKPIFRLNYEGPMIKASIIILTPNEIIVKNQTKGWLFPWQDTAKLNDKEKRDYDILYRFSPINDTNHKNKWTIIYLDSLAVVYPELLDPKYYKYLLDKSADYGKEQFEYSVTKIPISKKTFKYLINLINESGYWQLPYENICNYIPTDADGFTLEANTPNKYNIVNSISCPRDTTKYTKACQELVKAANMDKDIRLIWGFETSSSDSMKIEEIKIKGPKLRNIKKKK